MRKIFIDCRQEIPCDPCQYACQTGAIRVDALTDLPEVLPEKCIGCDNCVAACPGQACFLVDEDFSDTEAAIDFAYEFLPVPRSGDIVEARDNDGRTICPGRVVKILERDSWKGTRIVRLAVPKNLVYDVRGMGRQA